MEPAGGLGLKAVTACPHLISLDHVGAAQGAKAVTEHYSAHPTPGSLWGTSSHVCLPSGHPTVSYNSAQF